MQIGLNQIRATLLSEKKSRRKRAAVIIIVFVALAIFYLCSRGRGFDPFNPIDVFKTIGAFIRVKLSAIPKGDFYENRDAFIAMFPYYGEIVSKLQNLLLMFCAGAVLALSGTVYQTSMRNPMAVPTMLGVSSGVSLAQMIMVIIYASDAYYMAGQRYILSYAISIGTLLIIIAVGKIVGGKRASVADMLIVGTIVNRIFRMIMNYIQTNMDSDTLEIYQDYSQNAQDYFDSFTDLGILVIVSVAVMLPLFLMSFSFNMVSFEDEDGKVVGVRTQYMRVYGLIAGGVLTATAMIHAGNIGMLAMVVPLVCRYIYSANFKNLIGTSAAWGGIILVAANLVRRYTYIGDYQIPVGNIVSLLAIPLIIWIIKSQKTAWSQVER